MPAGKMLFNKTFTLVISSLQHPQFLKVNSILLLYIGNFSLSSFWGLFQFLGFLLSLINCNRLVRCVSLLSLSYSSSSGFASLSSFFISSIILRILSIVGWTASLLRGQENKHSLLFFLRCFLQMYLYQHLTKENLHYPTSVHHWGFCSETLFRGGLSHKPYIYHIERNTWSTFHLDFWCWYMLFCLKPIWVWLKKWVWIVPRVIRTYGSVWITCVLVWIMGYGSHVVPGYGSEPYILSRSHLGNGMNLPPVGLYLS